MDRDKNGRFCKAQKEEKTIRGWKGFEPGLVCRGMQYKEGEVFEAPEAVPCGRSIHFCHKHPLDVFSYYAPGSEKGVSEYAEVEALGDVNTQDDKSATNKLKIVGKLSLAGLCKAAIDLTFSRAKWTKKKTATGSYGAASATGYNGAASAIGSYGAASATGSHGAASATGYNGAASATGSYGAASATGSYGAASATGYNGAASATGYNGAASATGSYGAASATGYNGAASAIGYNGAASATGSYGAASAIGSYGAASATGSYGAASATGYNGAASATGSYGAASATGDQGAASAIGEESVACAFGVNGQAKASIGSFIVVAEWKRDEKCEWHRVSVKSIQVDGEKIKADTWYCLENGEFSEVK